MPTVLNGPEDLLAAAERDLGATDWEELRFEQILQFAQATGDHQWIHVDRERCAAESPYRVPVAHGYFTLSLVAGRFFELVAPEGFAMVLNYGTQKVRFPNPLKEGDRYRVALRLGTVQAVQGGWWEATFHAQVVIEGQTKPACAAEVLFRFLPR
jgi:acyl dehydratase